MMDYFEVLGLQKEPFMDTADPYFFHAAPDREEILTHLEVAVRVGRGLACVFGEVGSGKTTLAQTLEQNLLQDESFVLRKVFDPSFSSEYLFLTQIAMVFEIERTPGTILELKNSIKNYLFKKGVEEGKTILLIIDEAQKLTLQNLETLRILLNYQAPNRKLLNIILFGQPELMEQMRQMPNLTDRITSLFFLSPLDRIGTHDLIRFRLKQAGLPDDRELFSEEAKDRIYDYGKGNVRKVVNLCHDLIEELVIRERNVVTLEMVEKAIGKKEQIQKLFQKESVGGNGKMSDSQNGSSISRVPQKSVKISGFIEKLLDKIWN
ncbi:MAG: AAA family ATPase [Candidatus Eremiobacteraeota bacterium]|nr:AAA family ATPase [Candidatus Eremiobacteraeota bacterium]